MKPKTQGLNLAQARLMITMRFTTLYTLAAAASSCAALVLPLDDARQISIDISARHQEEYDLTPSATFAFAGITTFAQLPQAQCLHEDGPVDDILVLGFPFDTATSYRTGTRLGPNAIRQGSRAASLAFVSTSNMTIPLC